VGSVPTYRQGLVLIATAGLLWSLMALMIRLVPDADTWQVLFFRSLGLLPVLYFLLARSGGSPMRMIRAGGWTGLVAGLSLVGAFAGAIAAIQSTSVANAVFLFSIAPLLSAVLGWAILGERVLAHTWIAIALALAGIFIIVREGLSAGAGLGNLAALGSAVCFSIFTVLSRQSDTVPAILLGGFLSAIVASAVILAGETGFRISPVSLVICLLMGALVLGFGMTLFSWGGRAVPAAEMGLLALIEVLFAPVWVWLFLGETASSATLAGGAVVLAAIVLNTVLGHWRRSSLPSPL
jgi:drug/metabolite transporter, DME family